jgi:drug/metabolite transporter (DMT)-like permease
MESGRNGELTFRKYLVLLAIMVFGSLGDVLLKRGMLDVGEIHWHQIGTAILAVTNPWVAAGILSLLLFFASYSTALSWADLTYVLPATAFGYVGVAFLAKYFLHDQISPRRWAGIVLITLAVGFVAGGPAQTVREDESEKVLAEGER